MPKKRSFLIWRQIPRVLGLAIALLMAVYAAINIELFLKADKSTLVFLGTVVVGWGGLLIAWRRQLCGGLTQVLSAGVVFFLLVKSARDPVAFWFSLMFALPGLYLVFGSVVSRHGSRAALSSLALMTSPWLILGVVTWANYVDCTTYRSATVRDVPDFKIGEPMRFQKQRLINAFATGSLEGLNQFFANWHALSTPIGQVERQSLATAVAHAYSIFENFYRPYDEIVGNQPLSEAPCFIVQGAVIVTIRPTLERDKFGEYDSEPLEKFVVKDFNPRLPKIQARSVYLTEGYERMLSCFLGGEHLPIGWSGDVMATPTAIKASLRRQEFLQHMATIIRGHWSGWRIISDPKVISIDFVPTLDEAVVLFESGYAGGEAVYYHNEGRWVLVDRVITWIT